MVILVVLLSTLLAVALLAIVRVLRGQPLVPVEVSESARLILARNSARNHAERRVLFLAGAAFLVALLVSRNFILAVIVGAAVVLWPLVAGGGKAERAELAKLEALVQWTESLRDLAQKGSGLESVIPRTSIGATDVLAAPLRQLSSRLAVRVPLPHALALFADEVNHASADLVVGALALAARQRKGQLSRVLSALSSSLREELEQRTKVMRERNVVRREAAQVAILSAILVVGATFFSPPSLPNSTSTAAQVLPIVLAAAFFFVFSRVRKLAEPAPEPRFLSSAAEVLDAASYRPKGARR